MTPKRKSLANANATPNKVQKIAGSPMSQKKNKSPKTANQISPQKKQMNGKQHTPKGKKGAKPEPEPEEDEEVINTSLENDSESSDEQDLNGSAAAEDDSDDEDDDDDDVEEKPGAVAVKGKPVQNQTGQGEERKFSVFVGGLDYKTTEADIRGLFNKCSIVSIFILRNPVTKRPSGAAFVNLKDEASRKRALTNNGADLHGRTLKVCVPSERKPTAGGDKKKKLLEQLKLQVNKLEKELSGTGGAVPRKNFQKATGGNRPKNNFNKKNFNKNAIKSE